MLVSIVVTTKNEAVRIGDCLTSVRMQMLDSNCELELIVIDNFSSDSTAEIARSYTKHVFQVGPERNSQRNYGLLRVAKGDVLMWVDADMALHPFLVRNSLRLLIAGASEGVVGIRMPEYIIGRGLFGRARNFERTCYENTPIDGARMFTAHAFRLAGGFPTEWEHGPDDWDLDKRLLEVGKISHLDSIVAEGDLEELGDFSKWARCKYGRQIPINRVQLFHNELDLTPTIQRQKKIHYSADCRRYVEKWGMCDEDVRMQFSIWYRAFGLFWNRKNFWRTASNLHLYIIFLFYKSLIYLNYRRGT